MSDEASPRRLGMVTSYQTACPEPTEDELVAYFDQHREVLSRVLDRIDPFSVQARHLITRASAALRVVNPALLELLSLPADADPVREVILRVDAIRVRDQVSWRAIAKDLGTVASVLTRWRSGASPSARVFVAAAGWVAARNQRETG